LKLSVLLPIYNEEAGLAACLDHVLASTIVSQVIAVDDCSTDESLRILQQYQDPRLIIVRHDKNGGKGASVRTAIEHANGDLCIIQDADT
jgi:glycosyltransferase involved in cell wall biosynthesis